MVLFWVEYVFNKSHLVNSEMNVNLLPTWIFLSIFLHVLFIYMYAGVEGVTLQPTHQNLSIFQL